MSGKKKSFTSRERRGILGVALAALLVTGAGLALRFCGNEEPRSGELTKEQAKADEGTILLRGDTISNRHDGKKDRSGKDKTKDRKKKRKAGKKSSPPKTPVIRDPLSDTIPLN